MSLTDENFTSTLVTTESMLSQTTTPSGINSTRGVVRNITVENSNVFDSKVIIPLYIVIFLLSVIGNTMVLFTLFRNKRMRTVTNVYLVNLALADLLLGVLCMPFTLIGQVLRNFIFGGFMCKLIPYFQAVSVSVAVWTLVAISLERYFAICSPLKSRRWQTQFHAYKMICFVWIASLLWSSPVLLVSTLTAMKQKGTFKCREEWPSKTSERAFNLFLDGVLLIIPLVIMTLAYSLIVNKLWKGLQKEIEHNNSFQQIAQNAVEMRPIPRKNNNDTPVLNGGYRQQQMLLQTNVKLINKQNRKSGKQYALKIWFRDRMKHVTLRRDHTELYAAYNKTKTTLVGDGLYANGETKSHSDTVDCREDVCKRLPIRSNYMDKSIEAKKKVIRMLFVIVLEFFICWAPLHILNTWYLYFPKIVYESVGPTGISLVQLLAYISSCCNPITYCFMNRKFRQAFLSIFCSKRWCCCCCSEQEVSYSDKKTTLINNGKIKIVNNSDGSINESTIYPGRASTLGRSEVLVLEGEDRV